MKEAEEHQKNIKLKLLAEIKKRSENLSKRNPMINKKQNKQLNTVNKFLEEFSGVEVEHLDEQNTRYRIQKHLFVTIQTDPVTTEILRTNICLSEVFSFRSLRYFVFFENSKKGEDLIANLELKTTADYSKFSEFNQVLSKFIENLLYEKFRKQNRLDAQQSISIFSRIFNEVISLLSALKTLVLSRKVLTVSIDKNMVVKCLVPLLKLNLTQVRLVFKMGSNANWGIQVHPIVKNTDQFLYKLKDELKVILEGKTEKAFGNTKLVTKDRVKKLVSSIETVGWAHIDKKKSLARVGSKNRSKPSIPRN